MIIEDKKIKNGCTFLSGYAFKSSDFSDEGTPVIKIANIQDKVARTTGSQKLPFKKISQKLDKFQLEDGDILIAMTGQGSVGRVGKLILDKREKALLNQRVGKFICDEKNLHKDFLYYVISSKEYERYLFDLALGSGQPNLSPSDILNVEIPFPDLPIQRRIAEILSALDDKIELNRRMNQTLEQMVQSLYEKYSEVDEFVPLTDLIDLNPKLTLKKGTVSQYVEMSNLSETSASIKQSVLREYSGGAKFQNNDTLLARITPCLQNGKTGFVDILGKTEVGFGSTEYIVMRAKQSISPYFVYCVARNNTFREHTMRSMTGTSGRQRVQIDMLVTFDLPKWSSENMEVFHTSAHAAFQKIKANSAETATLTQLRDTLLPKLMSGEIDVIQTKLTEQHEPVLS